MTALASFLGRLTHLLPGSGSCRCSDPLRSSLCRNFVFNIVFILSYPCGVCATKGACLSLGCGRRLSCSQKAVVFDPPTADRIKSSATMRIQPWHFEFVAQVFRRMTQCPLGQSRARVSRSATDAIFFSQRLERVTSLFRLQKGKIQREIISPSFGDDYSLPCLNQTETFTCFADVRTD
jgi:hypothetical protein